MFPSRVIAVLSSEDTNEGKSTAARHLFRPRMEKLYGACQYFLVENFGAGFQSEGETRRFRPEEMPKLMLEIAKIQSIKKGSAELDISGGQAKELLTCFKEARGAEARIDMWVYMITAKVKFDKAMEALLDLQRMGVPAERVTVVINRSPAGKTFQELIAANAANGAFALLEAHANENGYRVINATIPENAAIGRLRNSVGITIDSLASGAADYQAEFDRLIAEADAAEQRGESDYAAELMASAESVFNMEFDSGLAKTAKSAMDNVWAEIFDMPTSGGVEVVEA